MNISRHLFCYKINKNYTILKLIKKVTSFL